jgi:hypothetical protein
MGRARPPNHEEPLVVRWTRLDLDQLGDLFPGQRPPPPLNRRPPDGGVPRGGELPLVEHRRQPCTRAPVGAGRPPGSIRRCGRPPERRRGPHGSLRWALRFCRSVCRPLVPGPATKAQPHRPSTGSSRVDAGIRNEASGCSDPTSRSRPGTGTPHREPNRERNRERARTPGTEPGTQPGTGTHTGNRIRNATGNLDKMRHAVSTPTLHPTYSPATTTPGARSAITRRRRAARPGHRRDSPR